MKKTFFTLSSIAIIAQTSLTNCESWTQKKENAQNHIIEAKKDLKTANQQVNIEVKEEAYTKEWEAFQKESEIKIKENNILIDALKIKIKRAGKSIDKANQNKIDSFEKENKHLTEKIALYNKSPKDWEAFKNEFNDDMKKLIIALENFKD